MYKRSCTQGTSLLLVACSFMLLLFTAGSTTLNQVSQVVEAGLVQEFIKTTRVVALIEVTTQEVKQGGEQALLIFQTARVPVHSAIDLSIEQVLPIDTNLKCEIDTSSTDVDTDVLVNITSGKVRLLFEMPFSQRTNTFVSEVLRAAEVISKRRGPPPEFTWLLPYHQNSPNDTSSARDSGSTGPTTPASGPLDSLAPDAISPDDVSVDVAQVPPSPYLDPAISNTDSNSLHHDSERSPDLGVNRHNIATGISPTPIAARESHIRHQMALREDSYTDIHNFTVFAGTWNVNGRSPTVGLAEWLSVDEDPPDVYVLNGIHPKAKYQKVRLVRLVGMMLIVLVQEKHLAYVRNVATDTVGTGIMNKMGNKGAVSVRLDLHSTSICFVNAHLAAHQEELERRNEDHDCIFQRTCFHLNINSPPKTIKDHEINMCDVNIREVAKSGQFKILVENEQLTQQRNLKRIFHKFKEGDINFKPTFKYDVDSDEWDSSEKARLPAWCDRILWYGKEHSMFIIKVIDTRRYRRIYEEVMKKLDKLENEFLPQVTIDTTEIILEPVPVQFEFIKKLNDTSYCKPWLSIRPYVNFIMPGDYERSCFGSSINALVHMNKPFREVPMAKLIDLESKQPKDLSEMPYAVPKELWYLVDHLHSHALQVEGLFTYRGLQKEIVDIRTALDEGVPNDLLPGSVHSVAEALLLFLEALPEPVIPYNLYHAALDATPNFSLCKDIIYKLPDYHRNVFTYLMAFLKELLNHSEDNNLDAKT
ncbi:Inositol polyphosphate 5-phosphatase OCRL-like, partial [Homarus americanus]